MPEIVKVKYIKDGQPSGQEYSYFSEAVLTVGDLVTVPAKWGTSKAQVTAINVPESEIEAIKTVMRTIPCGALIDKPEIVPLAKPQEAQDGILSDAEFEALATNTPTAIIVIHPETNPGYIALKTSLTSLLDYAQKREIKTDADLSPANEDLVLIAKCKKELVALSDQYIKPIKGHLAAAQEVFGVLNTLLADANAINKAKVQTYIDAQKARAVEIAEINRKKEELSLQEAALNNGATTIDTTPIFVPAPVKHVSSQSGSISEVAAPSTWELEDWDKVPKEYKILDAPRINKVVRSGGSIPGIKVITHTTIRTNTR
jgi:hypothetical protein